MEHLTGKVLHMDCFDLLAQLPDESINLAFLDPPYNIGVFCKMPPDEYLAWCERWIAETSRALKPNGAFWVCHKDPDVLVDLSRMIAAHGRGRVNWVTWDKYNRAGNLQGFMDGYTVVEDLRSFQVMAEYLVYHADEGGWTAQCDRERGFIFEPLRAYLDDERKRAGIHKEDINECLGFRRQGGMASRHYFSRSQWWLPTSEHYEAMRKLFNCNNGREYKYLRRGYEDLHREYEDLRREYESLRYTFNNPGKVSSVWQIPPAPASLHPTPKPEPLLARVIQTTSNPGDLVLDFFAGSFTTAHEAERLGRRWICCDNDARWIALGKRRLYARQLELL
jgi:adenine-specific DNA-methyltransferase